MLEPTPVGGRFEQSDQLREVCSCLEYFIPGVLRERHPEWKHESLDGVIPFIVRKTGKGEAELIGECILISDQSVAPIHLRMQIASDKEEIAWLECRLGERKDDCLRRVPYNANLPTRQVLQAAEDVNTIRWFYAVTFGERQSL
jgi:hypothetical protein